MAKSGIGHCVVALALALSSALGSSGAAVLGTGGGRTPVQDGNNTLGPPVTWERYNYSFPVEPEQECLDMVLSCYTCVHPLHEHCEHPVGSNINYYNAYNAVCFKMHLITRIYDGPTGSRIGATTVVLRGAMREELFDKVEVPDFNRPNVSENDVILVRKSKCHWHLCNGCGRPVRPLLPLAVAVAVAAAAAAIK